MINNSQLPFWAAAQKGLMTYAFTHMGNFFLLLIYPSPPSLSLGAQILVLRPRSQSHGPNPSLKAQILSWGLKSHLCDLNLILEAKI